MATVAGIPQDKPSSDSNKNGVSCTPINSAVISATLKPASGGTNINCQVTNLGIQKQLPQVFIWLPYISLVQYITLSLEGCLRWCRCKTI